MTNPPHARTSDLPGWPTPPRARDIPAKENSWGWVWVGQYSPEYPAGVVQDEIGRLWANGDYVPEFRALDEREVVTPGAILFWTEQGIGLFIHPKSYPFLGSLNTYDMEPDKWVPIAAVAEKLPDFVQDVKH